MLIQKKYSDFEDDKVILLLVCDFRCWDMPFDIISSEFFNKSNLQKKCSNFHERKIFDQITFEVVKGEHIGLISIIGYERDFFDAIEWLFFLIKKFSKFHKQIKDLFESAIIIFSENTSKKDNQNFNFIKSEFLELETVLNK